MICKNPPVFIIAEAGVNHNGDLQLAHQLIDVAADAGVDAVKFQTFLAEAVASQHAPKAAYQKKTTDSNESQLAMLKKLELSHSVHFELRAHCEKRNIQFLSTPFDFKSAEFLLNDLQLSCIKISSGDLTTAPLLLTIARKKPKIILSTGMSTLTEIEMALSVIAFGLLNREEKPSLQAFLRAYSSVQGQQLLKEKVMLLHCTSNYPVDYADIHLRAMDTLRHAFGLQVGYSDHSLGITVPIAAVARGAVVIEKHFTLDKKMIGPDHAASLEPAELKKMVQSIREVELALGSTIKTPSAAELDTKQVARKSLVAVQTIQAGEKFTTENMGMKRPGTGVSPIKFWDYLNTESGKTYEIGECIDG